MIACALRAGQRGLDAAVASHRSTAYFRFHRVPPEPSSRSTPRAARSSRMRSAAAKSRRRRAAWRSSISRSISSTGTGGCVVLGPPQAAARRARDRSRRSASRIAGTSPAPSCAGVDRGVQRAHQLEHRAERRGGVEVVLHRVGERLARLARRASATSACDAVARHASRAAPGNRSAAAAPPRPAPRPAHVKFSCLR